MASKKTTRPLSAYNIFVREQRLAGLSMKTIGEAWRSKSASAQRAGGNSRSASAQRAGGNSKSASAQRAGGNSRSASTRWVGGIPPVMYDPATMHPAALFSLPTLSSR